MEELEDAGAGRGARRRPPSGPRTPERWRWGRPLVVAALVAAITGVLVPVAVSGALSSGRGAAQQLVPFVGRGEACPDPGVSIDSPVPGAVVRPGRLLVTGRTAGPGTAVQWTLSRADGTPVATGAVTADAADGTYHAQVDVAPGDWDVTTRPLPDDGDPACAWTAVPLSASGTVEGVTWSSGASGEGVASGEFAAWRGTPVPVAGTWVDQDDAPVELWTLQPGAQFGDWDGGLDVAVGAIGDGETWAEAAAGAYDERWVRSLQGMARLREGRTGTTYVRFAHEMNGDWYPWSVTRESRADFIAAWQRYRALQVQWFPGARLVFAPNDRSAGDVDWRTLFPGREHVDVVSMSYFNHYVEAADVDGFWERALARDSTGAPEGIQGFADFARDVGLPFAVSEWGPHAAFGDGETYTEQMYQWFRANAGTGPGQLLYEVLFNVGGGDDPFPVFPETNVPLAAEAYRRLW